MEGLNNNDIANDKYKNPGEFLLKIIKILVKKNVLKKNDYKMYEAFIQDLESFGYNYDSNYSPIINNNYKDFLTSNSEFKFYLPRKQRELMGNNGQEETHKVLYHYPTNTIYKDILLIINLFDKNIETLKNYTYSIYHKNFPNIIYLSSSEEYLNKQKEIIYCSEAKEPSLSYICLKDIYKKFPDMKGYLYLTNEILLKIWELDYLDFNIPWFCSFNISQNDLLDKLINENNIYKNNLEIFYGKKNVIGKTMPHFFYVPKNNMDKIVNILNDFYKYKIPQEFAIINSMGIALLPWYQYIYFRDLDNEEIKQVMTYIKKVNEQIIVYPVDYTREDYREEIDKYYYFMKAEEFD